MHGRGEIPKAPGFSGGPPGPPDRLVERPGLLTEIVRALRARQRLVAVTGPGGAGKTTLAAQACGDRQVRRSYRDGIAWLEANHGQDPAELLAALAYRLRMPHAASGFATVEQGRELLAPRLLGKRLLIVVENVSERPLLQAFRDLTPMGTVLFTTDQADLATAVKATEIHVDGLTRDQSLDMLGRWTGQDPATLPQEAGVLCARSGNLPLGVALAGGMITAGLSFQAALDWVKPLPDQPDGEPDSSSHVRALSQMIEASSEVLPKTAQARYEELAVFSGRSPFPSEAAQALWHRDLKGAEVHSLLAGFVDRALLTARGAGWYTLHQLQYEVLENRLSDDGLAAAHAQLLDGYRIRYPKGWAESAADPYLAGNLVSHLRDAGRSGELRAVLTDTEWIQGRLTVAPPYELIHDYQHAVDPLARQIMRTLRLSAASLAASPAGIRSHLASRLLNHPDPGIAAWAADLTDRTDTPPAYWLTPVVRAAATPVNPVKQILTGHAGPVRAVTVSRNGGRAVSGSDDGTVRVWDLATGREEAVLVGHTDWVRAVAVCRNGSRAVSGSDDGKLRLWDLATGREKAVLTGHDGEVFAVAITRDGALAVSGGSDRTVRVWDLTTGSERAVLAGHTRTVWSVAVTSDGALAVSGSGDGTIRVWDLATGREEAVLTGHAGEVFAVAITPDGALAVSGGGDGTLRVWDVPDRRQQAILTGHTGWVRTVTVSPDETLAVSGGEDRSVRVWDLAAGREEAVLTGHDGEVFAVAITPDGAQAVSGSSDETVRSWDLTAGRGKVADTGWIFSSAISRDGARAVTGGSDATVRVWDLITGREEAVLAGHTRPVFSVAMTPDGALAFSGGSDRTVRVWDLATGSERAVLAGHTRPVWSVAATPDGTLAVSGGGDGTVRVWDLATGQQEAVLAGHDGEVFSVAITPDGALALSGGSDRTVRVWDLATGSERTVLAGHTHPPVWSVAITPDKTLAVSGGEDGSVRIWDLATGREKAVLAGHDGEVLSVAITADGRRACSGGADATIRVWDLVSRAEIARWSADHPVIECAALSGRPLKIGVGQGRGCPCILELHATPRGPGASESPAGDRHRPART
jgi:WD40 repeat protein